ncbi:MAG TPA: AIR synthase-related protein, partial [Candidatus Polarisedimenticolia bacterium]|nr:AIR synthase-related protein [Candidatus Polarisedimenticolia bacterium]
NLDKEKELHLALRALIHSGVVKSAHDCSDGGLAVALAESCMSQLIARETPRFIGAEVDLSTIKDVRLDALLFGETQARVVISVAALNTGKVLAQAKILGVPATVIGKVGGTTLQIKSGEQSFSASVAELHDGWWNSIARAMK